MFVFRNFTIENLFKSDTKFSGYGDISFLPDEEKEIVWFYQVPVNFNSEACSNEINSFVDKLQLVAGRMHAEQTLYVCSLINLFPVNSVDSDLEVKKAVENFNQKAIEISRSYPNLRFVDVSEYFSLYPSSEWINWKFYFFSQMIVAPTVAKDFKDWFDKRISQIKGARKKCLVLDLDNTLWGGVLGEDGIDGIKIGGDYPGNAFLYFQEALIQLSKQGVILTICSKNNEKDVLEAWEKNPFIKLNKDFISAYRINWNNKADNIREIAKELNIGLDSMVFIDDNPSERELVKTELPMVTVPDFPKQPYGLMPFFKNISEEYFRIYELTDEDKKKTEQYKANAQRASESSKFTNLEDFIKSLNIEIDVIPADEFNIPRIAQMTQKTNQFNLTTKRYTESDISNFMKNGDMVYCISVKDKFGDNGITGAIILAKQNEEVVVAVDTLLLSCRILGKGIEDAFFKSILNLLKSKGYKALKAAYYPTAKNSQVAEFYDRFQPENVSENDGNKYYTISLDSEREIPEFYKIKCE